MMNKNKEAINMFSNILHHLKIRRGVYVSGDSYSSLVDFIGGYQVALYDMSGCTLYRDFHDWLQKKINRSFANGPEWYILDVMSKQDETVATQKLFELLDEFIEDKKAELSQKSI